MQQPQCRVVAYSIVYSTVVVGEAEVGVRCTAALEMALEMYTVLGGCDGCCMVGRRGAGTVADEIDGRCC